MNDDARILVSSKAMIAGVGTFRLRPDPSGQPAHSLDLEIKELTDIGAGEFTGLCAVYGLKDEQGDVVEPGAFRSALEAGGRVPILWAHDPNQVLGFGELQDTPTGLRIRGRLNLAVARAKEIYELLKQKAIAGLSIGYTTLRSTWKGTTRHLTEVRLFEVSLTPFPAQALATVSAVKSQGQDTEQAELAAICALLAETRQWLRSRGR